jgi:hypothetical protein
MSLNIEASISVDMATNQTMGFRWASVEESLRRQRWDLYRPTLGNTGTPAWRLLYDEFERELALDESEESTLVLTLSHTDTARVQAQRGEKSGKGTQYLWLSRDCYGFFPPLTILNQRGMKRTFSCLIRIRYIDLGGRIQNSRVTFEAENNFDFRLGTGPLRYSRLVQEGDLAALTRTGENDYELRVFGRGSREYELLIPYAITFIGHQGKQYGYISNADFERLLGVHLGRPAGRRDDPPPPQPLIEV